jgi:hypothetical protein
MKKQYVHNNVQEIEHLMNQNQTKKLMKKLIQSRRIANLD